tara:strand:- start:86 stop:598 length:513 start_codon:yes stop_codon:yes gene_type:complete
MIAMNVIVKKTNAIVLVIFALVLTASKSPDKTILDDSCDYLEINSVYNKNAETVEAKLRFVQYIWWEWRDSILVPVRDPNTGQRTGLSKRSSGFVVREYIIVVHGTQNPQNNAYLSKTKTGWTCIYYDGSSKAMRRISFKWIITTHTLYDPEADNKDIIATEDRNKFIKR